MRMNVRIGDVLRLNIPDSDVLHNREVIVTDVIRSVFDRTDVMGIEFVFRPEGKPLTLEPEKFASM